MDTPQKFPQDMDQNRIVYVRPVNIDDLPEEVKLQAPDADDIYAVHAANGDRLALVRGQKLAFVLARQNDMEPVHVQ
jgi:hypothetical protein